MKNIGIVLLLVGMSVAAIGQHAPIGVGVPEIDPGSAGTAIALLSGTVLVLKSRRKK